MNGLPARELTAFLKEHRLPADFEQIVSEHYQPLARWIHKNKDPDATEIIGISGGQGTGKSTLADFLSLALAAESSVANLSLDDFYLTRGERLKLAETIHPLLATRGVPGTHDVTLVTEYLERLTVLAPGERLALPRFDKAQDDRAPVDTWPTVTGPVDLIILEGWCIGARPQSPETLRNPINALEGAQDPDARWRTYVNDRLRGDYGRVFSLLDRLIFLKAPDMATVREWRHEQETKLAAGAASGPGIMDEGEIAEFVQFYERYTRANIEELPAFADVTLELDSNHGVVTSRYRSDV